MGENETQVKAESAVQSAIEAILNYVLETCPELYMRLDKALREVDSSKQKAKKLFS